MASVQKFKEPWRDLASAALEPNPFVEADLVEAALSFFPDGGDPQLLMVKADDALVGLLPIGFAKRFVGLPLTYALSFSHAHQFLGTPLVRTGYDRVFARTIFDWLDGAPRQLQFLRLQKMVESSPVFNALQEVAQEEGRIFEVIDRSDRPFQPRQIGYDGDVTERLSASARKKLAIKRRKLGDGALIREELSDGQNATTWTEDFLDLEQKSWKGALGTSFLSSIEGVRFLRDLMDAYHAAGRLRVSRLRAGNAILAMTIDIEAHGHLFGFKSAFDYQHKNQSPGAVLDIDNTQSFLSGGRYLSIDACTSGPRKSLDDLWAERRSIVEVAIGKRTVFDATALRTALAALRAKKYVVQDAANSA